MSTSMGGPALLWTALLLFSPDGMPAASWKSTLSLNPPWNRIFRGENVTLRCDGNNSLEANSMKWTHNNTVLAVTAPWLDIVNATFQDSGEYRCQSKSLIPSQPVYLEVFSNWLLLQSSSEVVQEGESFLIRCHGWKNRKVLKVIYYKDGIALKYWYENYNYSITNATTEDSGNYYCSGKIWQINHISESLKITVKKDSFHQSSYYLWQLLIPLLVAILFAVDTALFISTQQQFAFILKMKSARKGNKHTDPQPQPKPAPPK